jgi:hypothetical protein
MAVTRRAFLRMLCGLWGMIYIPIVDSRKHKPSLWDCSVWQDERPRQFGMVWQ